MRTAAAALGLCTALASSPSLASVEFGPVVVPQGPGQVSIRWQSDTNVPIELSLRSAGRPERRLVARAGWGVRRVEVDNLDPGAEYVYRIEGREGRFIAPPGPTQDVRFAVYGDSRSGDAAHRLVVEGITALRPDVVLSSGDVVFAGHDHEGWRRFFALEEPLLGTTSVAGARGNHDVGAGLFEALFAPGSAGIRASWGAMDVGVAHIVVVDTEAPLEPGSPQYDFVRRDLAAHAGRPLFVVMHRPAFSSGMHGGDPRVRHALAPLFQRYGVDLVFQGHDHHYERSKPINGVTYVVTGGAGAPLHGTRPNAWTTVSEASHHYLLVEASATRISVVAKRLDGTQLDAFDLDPRANEGRFDTASPLPVSHAAGCAALFGGRGRSEGNAALGTMVPVMGTLAVASIRRRSRRENQCRRA